MTYEWRLKGRLINHRWVWFRTQMPSLCSISVTAFSLKVLSVPWPQSKIKLKPNSNIIWDLSDEKLSLGLMSAKLEKPGSLAEMAMTQFRRNLELALRKAVFSQSSIDQLHFVICIITILLAVCTSDLLLLVVSFASAITINRYPINTGWDLGSLHYIDNRCGSAHPWQICPCNLHVKSSWKTSGHSQPAKKLVLHTERLSLSFETVQIAPALLITSLRC